MWAVPTIYYEHNISGLVASSELTGFEASKLLDGLESTWWKSAVTTTPLYFTFDAGEGETVTADYLTVSGHNLNSIGATLGLDYSDGATTGADLITNGGFGSDTSGWTAVVSSLASVASGQSGNCLEVTNSGAASGSAYQDVAGLTVNETYKLSVYFKKGTGVSGAIKIGTTADDDFYDSITGLTDAGWTEYTFYFTAKETTARITFVNESDVSSETALFDTATTLIVDWTDAFTAYAPSSDLTLVKEHTSQAKRLWRLKLIGTLSAVPYMAMAYWGELTEWDYLTAGFDPYAEEEEANINVSDTGVLLNDHIKHTKKDIPVALDDADNALYQKVKGWKDGAGLRNAIFAWNKTDYPSDIWVMRRKLGSFKATFTDGGLYRNIRFTLIGVKE